jgi:hypothetical protein
MSDQLHASAALPLRKNLRYPLSGLQSQSGRGGEEKNFPSRPVNLTPVVQPIT